MEKSDEHSENENLSTTDLSEEQQIKLLNFLAMTEQEDPVISMHYLTENSWDEAVAANKFISDKNISAGIK